MVQWAIRPRSLLLSVHVNSCSLQVKLVKFLKENMEVRTMAKDLIRNELPKILNSFGVDTYVNSSLANLTLPINQTAGSDDASDNASTANQTAIHSSDHNTNSTILSIINGTDNSSTVMNSSKEATKVEVALKKEEETKPSSSAPPLPAKKVEVALKKEEETNPSSSAPPLLATKVEVALKKEEETNPSSSAPPLPAKVSTFPPPVLRSEPVKNVFPVNKVSPVKEAPPLTLVAQTVKTELPPDQAGTTCGLFLLIKSTSVIIFRIQDNTTC